MSLGHSNGPLASRSHLPTQLPQVFTILEISIFTVHPTTGTPNFSLLFIPHTQCISSAPPPRATSKGTSGTTTTHHPAVSGRHHGWDRTHPCHPHTGDMAAQGSIRCKNHINSRGTPPMKNKSPSPYSHGSSPLDCLLALFPPDSLQGSFTISPCTMLILYLAWLSGFLSLPLPHFIWATVPMPPFQRGSFPDTPTPVVPASYPNLHSV